MPFSDAILSTLKGKQKVKPLDNAELFGRILKQLSGAFRGFVL